MPLEGRGHDIATDSVNRRVVVFARRPGYFALVIDVPSLTPLATLRPPEGHHFFGHGVFSADGKLLYATENDFAGDSPRGVVGIYDATGGFVRIGEFETGGVDSHEILLSPDGASLIVANGGIVTHPDFGRQKLDLAAMRPSIVKIDRERGDRIAETTLPASLNRLSMRHMSFDGRGNLWFGCQWEGNRQEKPSLVGRIDSNDQATLMSFPEDWARMARNYIGSVVASRDGTRIATSSPIGGAVFIWDAEKATPLAARPFRDGCGLSGREGHHFLATSGDGILIDVEDGGEPTALARREFHFDNHLRRLG
ncbi:DUF1513 domain-containing protein [Kaistia algarum]|nr:DUF1513 domain-containing protein [Kaistia algarum]